LRVPDRPKEMTGVHPWQGDAIHVTAQAGSGRRPVPDRGGDWSVGGQVPPPVA
jgi:hypothetical protein